MMLVSLLSYSQYPVVKTIGNEKVVIMTVKQGEDINKQFSILKDSLTQSNEELLKLRNMMSVMDIRNSQLSTNLAKSQDQIISINKQLDVYKSNYEFCERDLRLFKKDHKNIVTGLLILLGVWTAYGIAVF